MEDFPGKNGDKENCPEDIGEYFAGIGVAAKAGAFILSDNSVDIVG